MLLPVVRVAMYNRDTNNKERATTGVEDVLLLREQQHHVIDEEEGVDEKDGVSDVPPAPPDGDRPMRGYRYRSRDKRKRSPAAGRFVKKRGGDGPGGSGDGVVVANDADTDEQEDDVGFETSHENARQQCRRRKQQGSCGTLEFVVFLLAVMCGTGCSISSKIMYQLEGIGLSGRYRYFETPVFQTFIMFLGMVVGLPMHWLVLFFKIPFPGYQNRWHDQRNNVQLSIRASSSARSNDEAASGPMLTERDRLLLVPFPRDEELTYDDEEFAYGYGTVSSNKQLQNNSMSNKNRQQQRDSEKLPLWAYAFLLVPTVFDLCGTVFCMIGLVYLDASAFQLLRGSSIIFVSLLKQYGFGDRLYTYQWVGVFYNVLSVLLVGLTALLNATQEEEHAGTKHALSSLSSLSSKKAGETIFGVSMVLLGAFVQACQFVFEEKIMRPEGGGGNDDDNNNPVRARIGKPVPPLLLIGMEGFWGTLLCLLVVYPTAYYLPGDDYKGSYESPFNTWAMLASTPSIQWAFLANFVSVLGYNLFAILVTFLLSSIWHSILDNFRPITVWATNMLIFYALMAVAPDGRTIASTFGEPWTKYSWFQLLGTLVLLYGTAVYNAPNSGSIRLTGKWFHLFLNCSNEYEDTGDSDETEENAVTSSVQPSHEADTSPRTVIV